MSCHHIHTQDSLKSFSKFHPTEDKYICFRGGVLNQALRPGSQTPVPQKPIKTQTPVPGEWSGVLDANRAGMADNAEEFTKQFMSQLTGETAGNLPPQMYAYTHFLKHTLVIVFLALQPQK